MEQINSYNFRFINLYSGSSGNSTYIKTKDAELLFDAGKSAKALKTALSSIGADIKNIDAVFITHEHTDHISALKVLLKTNPIYVHVVAPTANYIDCCGTASNLIIKHPPIYSVRIGNTTVSSVITSHDSVSSVGYRIDYDDGICRHSFAIATDTGCITNSLAQMLRGCEAVMLESNHDLNMLLAGPYPQPLKARVMSDRGHLSNDDCASFSAELAKSGTRSIMLAHLSAENNTPGKALETVGKALEGHDIFLAVASQNEQTTLFEFNESQNIFAVSDKSLCDKAF